MPQNKEQKTITHVYAALTVSIVLGFIPSMSAAFLCAVMFLGAWIAAYAIRGKAAPDSLAANHMTFIIRTLWVSGVVAIPAMGAAAFYILSNYDPTAIDACAQTILNSGATDVTAMEEAVKPCMDQFMNDNMRYFINGTVIAAGPLLTYIGYRLAKGISRAVKGHRIGDIKSWF